MKNKLILSLALVLIVTLLAACAPQGEPSLPTPIPTPVVPQKPTYKVQRGAVVNALELRGRVSAIEQQELFFGADGTVDEVLVSRGEMVISGQVLARLAGRATQEAELADAQLELIKAQKALAALKDEAGLHSAEALVDMLKAESDLEQAKRDRIILEGSRYSDITLEKAETNLALARNNLKWARQQWEKAERLRIINPERVAALMNYSSALQQYDRAVADLNWYLGHASEEQLAASDADIALAEAEYEAAVRTYEQLKDGPDPYDVSLAETMVARAQVNVDKAQKSLDSLTITAPFDGEVLSISLFPGMQVTAFKSVLMLVDPAGLEITLLPTAGELADISVGQETVVRLPNQPGQELIGVVRYIPTASTSGNSDPSADQSVRVSIEDANSVLSMGEVAVVIINLEERENALWISPAALRTFQSRDFVIIQDGDLQRRVDVRLGLRNQERVEVLEGLSEGQVVLGP